MTAAELRAALRELHLSQREFARRLGVGPVTVNRWVTNELPVPGYAAYVVRLLREREQTRPEIAVEAR